MISIINNFKPYNEKLKIKFEDQSKNWNIWENNSEIEVFRE